MDNPKMNIGEGFAEQDRSVVNMGLNNVSQYSEGIGPAQTAFHSLGPDRGQLPGELPSPLTNMVVETSNTQPAPFDPPAMAITMRTRNG